MVCDPPKNSRVFLQLKFGSGCIYMYITAASPNKRSLGATNGLALTLVSIGRLIAPAMANSLLAFSIQYHILWGYAAYIVLIFLYWRNWHCFEIAQDTKFEGYSCFVEVKS